MKCFDVRQLLAYTRRVDLSSKYKNNIGGCDGGSGGGGGGVASISIFTVENREKCVYASCRSHNNILLLNSIYSALYDIYFSTPAVHFTQFLLIY